MTQDNRLLDKISFDKHLFEPCYFWGDTFYTLLLLLLLLPLLLLHWLLHR